MSFWTYPDFDVWNSTSSDDDCIEEGGGVDSNPPTDILPVNPQRDCSQLCNGRTPGNCFDIYPNCRGVLPANWNGFVADNIAPVQNPGVVIVKTIYWLISDNGARFPDDKGGLFDIVVRSVADNLTTSMTIFNTSGIWSFPQNLAAPNTLISINQVSNEISLIDDWIDRPNDGPTQLAVTFTTALTSIRYLITKVYEIGRNVSLKPLALPTDCLFFRDKRDYPPGNSGLASREPNCGATEAFLDSNQINDSSVTIDNRAIAPWVPTNHHNCEVHVPCWGSATSANTEVQLIVRNGTNGVLNPQWYGPAESVAIEQTAILTRNYGFAYTATVERQTGVVNNLYEPTNVGFVGLDGFSTIVPEQVFRKSYTTRSLAIKAYRVEDDAQLTTTEITVEDALSGNAFASSAFGNRPGFAQKRVVLQYQLWLNNWPTDLNLLTDGPPINVQFSGDMRIAKTLQAAKEQTGALFLNPYDGDGAKIGIMTIGNDFLGVLPTIETNQVVTWFVTRDWKVNGTLRVANVITLN